MISPVRTIALAAALAIGSTAAVAQTSTPKQDKSAMAAKKADCKRQAKAQHFGIHWIKRNRFIDECMKRS